MLQSYAAVKATAMAADSFDLWGASLCWADEVWGFVCRWGGRLGLQQAQEAPKEQALTGDERLGRSLQRAFLGLRGMGSKD